MMPRQLSRLIPLLTVHLQRRLISSSSTGSGSGSFFIEENTAVATATATQRKPATNISGTHYTAHSNPAALAVASHPFAQSDV